MDPLSALSVACNVLQLVESGGKLVSKALEAHKSATGQSIDNAFIEDRTQELQIFLDDLQASLSNRGSQIDQSIRRLAQRCEEISKDLISLLRYVRARSPGKPWSSLAAAFKQTRKESEIKTLTGRLDKLQRDLNLYLVNAVRSEQSGLSRELGSLRSEWRRLDVERSDQLQSMRQALVDAITSMDDQVKSWHNATDQHLDLVEQAVNGIANTISNTRKFQDETAFLQSLRFPSIHQRYEDIFLAHETTLQWLFDDTISNQSAAHYRDWLATGNGVFWIKGKPGCGKSTMMKYVSAHATTRTVLETWAGQQKLVVASFYFWNAGSKLQKSQEGLIRSLLLEILRKCPDLILPLKDRLASTQNDSEELSGNASFHSWTGTELFATFNHVISLLEENIRFCFFIDGLDEYGDIQNQNAVIKFIQTMAQNEQVKFCVSSRPWNEFEVAFGQNEERCLRLESHTTNDIKNYVEAVLDDDAIYRQLKVKDTKYEELVNDLVTRADGVFLWVFLAVRSLLKGLTNADSIKKLKERLQTIPPTLDTYFKRMFDSIEPEYKRESEMTFLTALEAEGALNLMIYLILEQESETSSTAGLQRVNPLDIADMETRARRQINARCRDILEVRLSTAGEGRFFSLRVDFLHRTARDFLNTAEMRQNLHDGPELQLIIMQRLVRAHLFAIKLAPEVWKGTGLGETLVDMLGYAERVEAISSQAMITELDECERFLCADDSKWPHRRKKTKFLSMAAQQGLRIYCEYRLEADPQLLKTRERPILDSVLQNAQSTIEFHTPVRTDVLQLLLQRGESPSARFEDSTIWERFMQRLAIESESDDFYPGDLVDALELLISHGARLDASITVAVNKKSTAVVMKSGRRLVVDDVVRKTASAILNERISPSELSHLAAVERQYSVTGTLLSTGLGMLRKWSPFS